MSKEHGRCLFDRTKACDEAVCACPSTSDATARKEPAPAEAPGLVTAIFNGKPVRYLRADERVVPLRVGSRVRRAEVGTVFHMPGAPGCAAIVRWDGFADEGDPYTLDELVSVEERSTDYDPHAVLAEQYDRVVARHIEEKRELRKEKAAVYEERDQCVALVASMAKHLGWKVGLAQHPPDPTWEPEWRTIVFIDLPTGQVSWHIHERELPWFEALPDYDGVWDGHSTPVKYERVVDAATQKRSVDRG